MKITIEPTGPNSARVVCRNVEHNGIKFLRLFCPIEWKSEDEKPKLIESAEQMILKKINENRVKTGITLDNLKVIASAPCHRIDRIDSNENRR